MGRCFKAIQTKVKKANPDAIGAIMGDQCDAESMFALKSLMENLGSGNIDCRQDGSVLVVKAVVVIFLTVVSMA